MPLRRELSDEDAKKAYEMGEKLHRDDCGCSRFVSESKWDAGWTDSWIDLAWDEYQDILAEANKPVRNRSRYVTIEVKVDYAEDEDWTERLFTRIPGEDVLIRSVTVEYLNEAPGPLEAS